MSAFKGQSPSTMYFIEHPEFDMCTEIVTIAYCVTFIDWKINYLGEIKLDVICVLFNEVLSAGASRIIFWSHIKILFWSHIKIQL